MRATGSKRRRAIGFLTLTAVLVVLFIPFGSVPAGAQTVTQTFPQVDCLANVNGTILHQPTDISITITAPDTVTPGQTFTVTFPGGTANLPTQSNGLNITQYANLFQTVQINGTNFVPGSIANPGTATLVPAGGVATSIVESATLPMANQIQFGQPGPFSPGTPGPANTAALTTPDISVNAVAPASGSVTLNMVTLTTSVTLNNVLHANVTCSVPTTTIITIPVTTATTTSSSTTSSSTTSTTIPTTTTSSSTTTSSTTTSSTTTSSSTTTTAPTTTTSTSTTTTTVPPTTTTSSSTTTSSTTTSTTHPTTTTTSSTTTSTTHPTTTTTSSTTTSTTHPSTTTTTAPTTTTTVPVTSTTTGGCKPGWGFGDKNHCHSGPPGLAGDPKQHGPQKARPLVARLIDSRPTGGSGVAALLVLTALGLFLTVTVGPRWRRRRR